MALEIHCEHKWILEGHIAGAGGGRKGPDFKATVLCNVVVTIPALSRTRESYPVVSPVTLVMFL